LALIVIPCALRHEMTPRGHGILRAAALPNDPVSAAHRSALRRARDDKTAGAGVDVVFFDCHPGSRLRLSGIFPHVSLVLYDPG
jgi:hypothetical protein